MLSPLDYCEISIRNVLEKHHRADGISTFVSFTQITSVNEK